MNRNKYYNEAIDDVLEELEMTIKDYEAIVVDGTWFQRKWGELKLYNKELSLMKHLRLVIEKKRKK